MKAAIGYFSETQSLAQSRVIDYLELTKPRVTVLVLFTVAAGSIMASRGVPDFVALAHTLIGTFMVAGGASALNQFLERQTDALMHRTENRPLPSGRLQATEVLVFGFLLGLAGVVYLALSLPHILGSGVAAFTFLTYVFLYTPLKKKTALNTLVGAVPGALPPVIGWTAVSGSMGSGVVALFLILFLWQIPHFLAIAWIYREDYARAGLRMLPVGDDNRGMTGRQMVTYCLALIPASLAPVGLGLAGPVYLASAVFLGIGFLVFALWFWQGNSLIRARRVLQASLIYLPALLVTLLISH